MKAAMDIAVVVPTYNRAHLLLGALESLLAQDTRGSFQFEIVAVDDGSTDQTSAVVATVAGSAAVPIKYIRETGRGQAHGANVAIRATSAPWIALFDDDQIADRAWLAELLLTAQRTGARCVGSRRLLRFEDHAAPVLGPTCRQLLGEHICYPTSQKYEGKLFPQGGTALVAREVLERVGFFDESQGMGGSDTDLFRAARRAGFEAWYAPSAVVFHLIPAYRTSAAYFRWASLRMGAKLATLDARYLGRFRLCLNCAARIGQAVLIHLPLLLFALATRNSTELMERKCLLWRAWAYARQTLRLLLPKVFPQRRFFGQLEFRGERTSAMAAQGSQSGFEGKKIA